MVYGDLLPPLVGREHEIKFLQERLKEAINGRGTLVLVAGEAGIGKTRLADEFRKIAVEDGSQVMVGRCAPGGASPYLPFQDAFEHHGARFSRARQLGILGWLKGPASTDKEIELEPKARKEKLFDSIASLILRISTSQPILIILDDLQWADPSSLGLLHYLARNIRSARALLVGIYQIEELEEEVEERPTLSDSLSLMRREDLVEELVLNPLGKSEVKTLLNAVLHSEPPDQLLRIIYSETEGNPLFILEAIKLLIEDQVLVRVNGFWRLSKPVEKIGIPRKVREVILRRLDKLSATEREVLDCASVAGDPFESQVLEKIVDLDRMKLLRTLNTVERRHRLIDYADGLYRFAHTLIQEVCYEELNDELRKQYHLGSAEAIETLNAHDLERYESTLAYHYNKAGVKAKALLHHIRAAESASHKYANEEAILHLMEALRIIEEDTVEKGHILEQLGDLLLLTGKPNDAIQNWGQAMFLYEKFDGKIPCAILHRKIGEVLGRSLGMAEEAFKEFRTAEGLLKVERNDQELAQLYRSYASLYAQLGDLEEAEKKCELAVDLAWSKKFTPILARSFLTLGAILLSKGRIESGLEYLNKALQLALSERLNSVAIAIYNNLGVTLEAQGEFLKASESFEKGLELAKRASILSQLPWLYEGLATTYLQLGKLEQALESAQSAVDLDRNQGQFRHLALSLCSLGKVHFRMAQTKSAREAIEEALMLAEQTGDHQAFVQSCVGLGDIALRLGDFERAKATLMRASEHVEKTGESRLAGILFPVLAALYIRARDVESSKVVLTKLDAVAQRSKSQALAAAANRMWGEFYALIGEWEKAFESFSKGLQLYSTIGQPHEHAETMVQLALAHTARGTHGDLQEAHQLLSRAIAIFESLHEGEEARRAEIERAKIRLR